MTKEIQKVNWLLIYDDLEKKEREEKNEEFTCKICNKKFLSNRYSINEISLSRDDYYLICDACKYIWDDFLIEAFNEFRKRNMIISLLHEKRQTTDCCNRTKELNDLFETFHIEFCNGDINSSDHFYQYCSLIKTLIKESKIWCRC